MLLSGGVRRISGAEAASCPFFDLLLHPGIKALWIAYQMARDVALQETDRHTLAFAVDGDHLHGLGIETQVLSWLQLKGLVACVNSECEPGQTVVDSRGRFDPSARWMLTVSGAEVIGNLTASMARYSVELLDDDPMASGTDLEIDNRNIENCRLLPVWPQLPRPQWDARSRELLWDGQIVKRFHGRAKNQILILSAFEEEQWPRCIDDPIPPHPEINPKLRLRDTISGLNCRQLGPRIRFRGDGTGCGVRWDLE